MFGITVNRQLLFVKTSFFCLLASLGPIVGFLPTIARQLGYSVTTFGAVMMVMSILTTILVPLSGIIVDKFRVKKKLFVIATMGLAVTSSLFMFVPRLPTDQIVELECGAETVLKITIENDLHAKNNSTAFIGHDSNELITCKLNCHDEISLAKLNRPNDQSNYCDDWTSSTVINNTHELQNEYKLIDVTFKSNDTERINNSYVFHVSTARIDGMKTLPTTCQCRLKTFCHIDSCSNNVITDMARVTTYRGNVLELHQFWIFFALLAIKTVCSMTSHVFINSICLDALEDKSEDYGKQKCWGSIGWGSFSIFIGWLVDVFSFNKKEKNYSPVFYSAIILTLCNLAVSSKLKVVETKKSTGKWKSVYGLFSKHYVIAFYIWATSTMFFHTIITHFLFWYMDDLVSENNDQSQRAWLKTLQGLAQGVQCFGGEIPFFFWSGWIIRKLGHTKCMALALGAMAVRMYLYTVISNPVWIILIELLNGISYALAFAVKMSYAKMMSPPNTFNTIIGFLGFFDCIGDSLGSLIGGYLFGAHGGLWSFRFFAYGSALMCCLNILANWLGLLKDLKTADAVDAKAESKETRAYENKVADE